MFPNKEHLVDFDFVVQKKHFSHRLLDFHKLVEGTQHQPSRGVPRKIF